jgi:DNA-binding Lrp family transcriptional regulator
VQQYGETLCMLSSRRWVVDDLDVTLIRLFAAEPRVGVLEASRRLGVARGTVQARLDKLVASGVIEGWGPDL